MGAVLLAGGTKGKRFALPNANIMIHQVLGGAEGQASDVEIRVKFMLKLKERLNTILSKHTGQPYDVVERACDRDNFMSAEDARQFGLVDEVVASRRDLPALGTTDSKARIEGLTRRPSTRAFPESNPGPGSSLGPGL